MANVTDEALMAEGGLNTDGAAVDPVSGNEVPTGSTAEEVRDDIPAKLSEGEYVVPADVVKFFGVHFFEKLRAKAKAGLEEMAADGRVGGEPTDDTEEEEDDTLPFSVDELQAEDDGADSMDAQMQDAGFAKGGAVTGNPTPADIQANTSSFNPAAYPIGFSLFGNTAPAATAQPTTPVATTTKVYVNAAGQTMVVPFDANGKPTIVIPAGFYPQTAAVSSTGGGSGSEGSGGGVTATKDDTANKGGRIKLEDVSSEGALLASGLLDIEQMNKSKKAGSVAGGLLGGGIGGALLGGTIGTGWQLSELRAKIQIADAYGYKDTADKLRAAEAEAVKGLGAGTKIVTDLLASGNMLAKSFLKQNPTPPTATATANPVAKPSTGGGTGGAKPSTGTTTTKSTGITVNGVKATAPKSTPSKVGASKPVTGTAKTSGGITVKGTATTGKSTPTKSTPSPKGKARGGLMTKKSVK